MAPVNKIPILINAGINKERYQKMAFQKYLDGKIDDVILHSLLATLEKKKKQRKQNKIIDLACQ